MVRFIIEMWIGCWEVRGLERIEKGRMSRVLKGRLERIKGIEEGRLF